MVSCGVWTVFLFFSFLTGFLTFAYSCHNCMCVCMCMYMCSCDLFMSMWSHVNYICSLGSVSMSVAHLRAKGFHSTTTAIIALHGHPNQQINANCSIRPKCQIQNGAFCSVFFFFLSVFLFLCVYACVYDSMRACVCVCVPAFECVHVVRVCVRLCNLMVIFVSEGNLFKDLYNSSLKFWFMWQK